MALQLETAQQILLDIAKVMPSESVPLDTSWGRVLAETVTADTDFPPFDRSPLDGYAVIASDVQAASRIRPVVLRQIDNVPAGSVPQEVITPGTASRIMTGAPVPTGATGVIRLEDTESHGSDVHIFAGSRAEKQICRQGEEITCGEAVLYQGTVINAGVMGMLAAMGKAAPLVYQKPRVALLATGSEVVPVSQSLSPGKIRNSNSYMLNAQVAETGSQAILLGIARDCVDDIAARLTGASGDLVITTGGASVGDYDLIGAVFERLGISLLFDRVCMKPGMPVLAGVKEGKLYIGLSGNPAAASISFEQLIRPVLRKMGGYQKWWRPAGQALLAQPFEKSTEVRRFVWARCWQNNGRLFVAPLPVQGNGMLKSAIQANSLIAVPANSSPLLAGMLVEIIFLGKST